MDVLVEFCRTGELTPLRKGMTAAEVERLLGPPERIRCMQGEQHLQRYHYGSLSLTITCLDVDPPDKEHLRLRSLGVSFDQLPLGLPEPIAQGLTRPWRSSRLDEVIAEIRDGGVAAKLDYESSDHEMLHQEFQAGVAMIVVFDGVVSKISG